MDELPEAELKALAGAERRLGRFILLLALAGAAVTLWRWGRGFAAAFAIGGALAYLNYLWIVRVVDTLVRAQRSGVPRGTYLKLFAPLVLLAGGVYVMVARAWLPPVGLLAGWLVLVAAVIVEALYEAALESRR